MRRTAIFASIILTGLTCISGALRGDTITFNDGTPPLQCRILEENADSIKVQFNRTLTIKDERVIDRSIIKDITRVPADQMDFEELRKRVVPTPDMLSVDAYKERINLLKPFVERYPTSVYLEQVEKLLDLLENEMELVEGGAVKLDGEWISAAQREQRRYNVDADIMYRQMRSATESHQLYEALRIFDMLEKNYPASEVYPDAVELAREIVPDLERKLQTLIVRQPSLVKEREDGLRGLAGSEVEFNRTKKAIDAERREFDQMREREKLAKTKWITFYEYDLDSLEDVLELVRKENQRLREINIGTLRATSGLSAKVMEFLHIKDLDRAEDSLRKAEAAGGNKTVLSEFKKEIDRLRKEAKDGGTSPRPPSTGGEKPNVTPPPTDTTGDLLKDLENPVARRARELEEEKERQRVLEAEREEENTGTADPTPVEPAPTAPQDDPPTDPSPDAVTPANPAVGTPSTTDPGTAAPATTEGEDTGDGGTPSTESPASSPKPETPEATPETPTPPASPAAAGGGLPLWNYVVIGIAAVLLVLTIIAKVTQKKKEGENPEK